MEPFAVLWIAVTKDRKDERGRVSREQRMVMCYKAAGEWAWEIRWGKHSLQTTQGSTELRSEKRKKQTGALTWLWALRNFEFQLLPQVWFGLGGDGADSGLQHKPSGVVGWPATTFKAPGACKGVWLPQTSLARGNQGQKMELEVGYPPSGKGMKAPNRDKSR